MGKMVNWNLRFGQRMRHLKKRRQRVLYLPIIINVPAEAGAAEVPIRILAAPVQKFPKGTD